MIHNLEIDLMRQANRRESRLFIEPRCNVSLVVGIVVSVASLALTAVSIASQVGAFAPDNPGGNGTESTIVPKQQVIDLQTNLASPAAQEKQTESALATSQASQKKWIYAATGFALVAVVAGAFVVMEKKK